MSISEPQIGSSLDAQEHQELKVEKITGHCLVASGHRIWCIGGDREVEGKIAPSEDLTADDGLTLQTLGRSHTASSILCTKLALGPFQLHVACQVSSAASTQTPESYADAWIF